MWPFLPVQVNGIDAKDEPTLSIGIPPEGSKKVRGSSPRIALLLRVGCALARSSVSVQRELAGFLETGNNVCSDEVRARLGAIAPNLFE